MSDAKKKKDCDKMVRYRIRKLYEDQIKKYEGRLGSCEHEVDVWVGDRNTGSFQKIIRLTRIAIVRNKAPVGMSCNGKVKNFKPHRFLGAIVRIGEKRNYQAIPESKFRVKVPCYAKQGGHATAKPCIAYRLTGICDPVMGTEHPGWSHITETVNRGWVLVEWENAERVWLPSSRVEPMVCETKRKRDAPASVDDDRPQTQGDIHRVESYYTPFAAFIKANEEAVKAKEREEKRKLADPIKKSRILPENATPKHCQIAAAPKQLDERFQKNAIQDELHERLRREQPTIEQLTEMGDGYWDMFEVRKIHGKSNAGLNPKLSSPPKFETIHTSFLYDVIRGNIQGCISEIDSVLDSDPRSSSWCAQSAYISAICGYDRPISRKHRKKHPGFYRICNIQGCKSRIHSIYWTQGVCYSHGSKSDKLRVECNERTASRTGRLCRHCFKNQDRSQEGNKGEDKTEEDSTGLCKVCLVRKPRKAGGRCPTCIP